MQPSTYIQKFSPHFPTIMLCCRCGLRSPSCTRTRRWNTTEGAAALGEQLGASLPEPLSAAVVNEYVDGRVDDEEKMVDAARDQDQGRHVQTTSVEAELEVRVIVAGGGEDAVELHAEA